MRNCLHNDCTVLNYICKHKRRNIPPENVDFGISETKFFPVDVYNGDYESVLPILNFKLSFKAFVSFGS